jgi:hypothetical protein
MEEMHRRTAGGNLPKLRLGEMSARDGKDTQVMSLVSCVNPVQGNSL